MRQHGSSLPGWWTSLLLAAGLALALPRGAHGDADARAGRSEGLRPDAQLASLASALEHFARCREWRAMQHAHTHCVAPAVPPRFAALFDDIVALAYGEGATHWPPLWQADLSRQLDCQRAIGAAVAAHVAAQVQPAWHAGHPALPAARAERPREWFRLGWLCDVIVSRDAAGVALPAVGPQCAAAIGAPGERVDVARLEPCLRRLLDGWLERAHGRRWPLRPNIVIVMADDQRQDAIGPVHAVDGAAAMPIVMDRLAGQGIVFENAYVTDPVCGPSRASFFSGQHVFRHGVHTNTGARGAAGFDDSSTLASWLEQAGYLNGFVGKYTNAYADRWQAGSEPPFVPPGWHDWRAFNESGAIEHYGYSMVENGAIVEYGHAPEDYSTHVLAAHARRFVAEAAASGRPFLLQVSLAAPHEPWTPGPGHQKAFERAPLWLPPSYFETDMSDKPAFMQALPGLSYTTFARAYRIRERQLSMMLSVDELVGGLLDQLEALGIADDTIFVYTSDNGHAWGEQRWLSKGCVYEACLRVPLLIRYPQLVPLPRSEQRIALNIDLAPTLAELAGVVPPVATDGASLVRVLDGTARGWREDFLIQSWSAFGFAGVHGGDFKYVDHREGEQELYDLASDPWELENLAADPAREAQLEALQSRLQEHWPGWTAFRHETPW